MGIKHGDTIRITGHKYFPGEDILPIGSEMTAEKIIPIHNAVEYQWGEHPSMNWWILPDDYEVISK